jgi:ribosomal-protein-alanine acetyltransferase
MRRELESPHGYYLVAVDDDEDDPERRLLGYAGLLAPSGSAQGDIQTIAVAPFVRGIGLGRGLMHALITQARRRHLAELFLEVRADNPIARALYESLGFEEIGVRRRYYRGGIDAVLMRLAVPPAVTRPAASGTGTTA